MQSYWQHDWETSQISVIPIALCVRWMIINVIKCKNNTSLCTSSSPPQAPLVFELVPLTLAILFGVWGGLKYTKEKEIHTVSCSSICFQNVWEFSLNLPQKHYSFCTTIYFKWLLWITLWIPLNIVISNLTLQSLCTT